MSRYSPLIPQTPVLPMVRSKSVPELIYEGAVRGVGVLLVLLLFWTMCELARIAMLAAGA